MNMNTYITFANAAAAEETGLLDSLGIDVKMLVLQSVAFLLLLFILSKYVYPILLKMIDDREKKIEESLKAAEVAQQAADESEHKTEKLLAEARKQAGEIVTQAKTEASAVVEKAAKKAKDEATHIAEQAQTDIARQVERARRDLKKEMINLVADATEKVARTKVDAKADANLLEQSIQATQGDK